MIIENRLDRVSLHGDLDLTRDQVGLEAARALKALVDAVLTALETGPLPQQLPLPAVKTVKNPF